MTVGNLAWGLMMMYGNGKKIMWKNGYRQGIKAVFYSLLQVFFTVIQYDGKVIVFGKNLLLRNRRHTV